MTHVSRRTMPLQTIFLFALSLGFLFVVWRHVSDIQSLWHTLAHGSWTWVACAVALQAAYWLLFTESFRQAFALSGIRRPMMELLPVTLSAQFINTIIPTATTSGMAFLADDAVRHGHAHARAMTAAFVQMLADLMTILIFALIGLSILFFTHTITIYDVLGTMVLMVIVGGLIGLLVASAVRPRMVVRVLYAVRVILQRFVVFFTRRHKEIFTEEQMHAYGQELSRASSLVIAHKRGGARLLCTLFASYLIHAATIGMLFVAFGSAPPLEVLFAGLSMGLLFWIVAPVPGGVGVVEGVMIAVFGAFAVPVAVATIVVFAFRGLTFWLPLCTGFVLLRTTRAFRGEERRLSHTHVSAVFVFLMGVINVLAAIVPPSHYVTRLLTVSAHSPLMYHYGGHLTAAISGFALVVLSVGLWRRKRVAYRITLFVLCVSVVGHMLRGQDYGLTAVGLLLMVWMWSQRRAFFALSDVPSLKQGMRTAFVAMAFTLTYGVAGFYILDNNFNLNFSFTEALGQTIVMFTRFYDPEMLPVPTTLFGVYFVNSIYIVGVVTFTYTLVMFLRPVLALRQAPLLHTRAVVAAIAQKDGMTELAPMAAFDDKQYFFSTDGVVVAYAAHHRAAVALGDPIGARAHIPRAIAQYKSFCEHNDWVPGFYQASADYLQSYERAGFHALKIGHQGVVALEEFSLEGRHNKSLRSSYNKLVRAGYTATVHTPPHDTTLMRVLADISDEWLETMHGTEKKFSLGWFDPAILRTQAILIVRDTVGVPVAFANIVRMNAAHMASIDLMRYRAGVHGIMDFLFVSLLQWARDDGYRFFGLGSSPLSGVGERRGDPYAERFLHFAYTHLNRVYNFQGLHAFKSKFRPLWSPRYVIYPTPAALTPIMLCLNAAINGGVSSVLSWFPRGSVSIIRRVIRTVPFTLGFLVIFASVAIFTGTHSATLSPTWMTHLGFAPYDIIALEWWRMISALFVTLGGTVFWRGLLLIAVIVGYAEWCFGSTRTITVFVGAHILTLITLSLVIVLPLHALGSTWGTLIALSRDVGPSAGYFGVLGMIMAVMTRATTPTRRMTLLCAAEALLCGVLVVTSGDVSGIAASAALAHLIALPIGWATACVVVPRHVTPTSACARRDFLHVHSQIY